MSAVMKCLLPLLLLCVFCLQNADARGALSRDANARYLQTHQLGVDAVNTGDYASAATHLTNALKYSPASVDTTQLLAIIKFKLGHMDESLVLLSKAVDLSNYKDLGIVANYVEILRSSGDITKAREVGRIGLSNIGNSCGSDCIGLLFNTAVIENVVKNYDGAIDLLMKAVTYDPQAVKPWHLLGELLMKRSPTDAEALLQRGVASLPQDPTLHFVLGTSLQFQGKISRALEVYLRAEQLDGENYSLKGNIAATYQSLGNVEEALRYYQMAIPHCPEDAGLYNNYGALLGIMGRDEEQIVWLERALELSPTLRPALINLAGHYQDEGDLDRTRELLHRAASPLAYSHTSGASSEPLLHLREALMLSPVVHSWRQMHEERRNVTRDLLIIKNTILAAERATGKPQEKFDVDTSLDRIHFYISYHGLNDRYLQDLIISIYHKYLQIEHYSPYIITSADMSFPSWVAAPLFVPQLRTPATHIRPKHTVPLLKTLPRRARIGFFSKFFGIFEPHGMLLDGVMKYLPRDRFEVFGLPVSRADVKPLSPNIIASCDEVHEISLSYGHAQEMIESLHLDVLVFADTVSEPMAHFLAHSRLAPIQVAFWGNPITSGSHAIDYFISADTMEHPYRTRMPLQDEPYSEQVVLMEGQGIWYLRPDIAGDLLSSKMTDLVAKTRVFNRADFGLQQGWFLYVLPQSTFKIHPLYELVLRDILARVPNGHLVVTGGRKPRWSEIYLNRLRRALGPELSSRLHMIDRVSSEQFTALLDIADVILHPFPFDGSKTSADALHAGKPLVTLPADYLRGRMGAAFLRTMDLPELVARNQSEYVQISVKLGTDRVFYNQIAGLVRERVDLIWEDMEVPFTWSNFLSNIIGTTAPSWDEFLLGTGRDVAVEKQRSETRLRNAQRYDQRWGPESWLLHGGVASLETELSSVDQAPCIFNDWRREGEPAITSTTTSHHNQATTSSTTPPLAQDSPKDLEITDQLIQELGDRRSAYLDLANEGRLDAALPIALSLYGYYNHFPLYLVEVGLIYVYLGRYAEGLQYCLQAEQIEANSALINCCLGLVHMYTSTTGDAPVQAFTRAIELKHQETAATQRALSGRINITPSEILEAEKALGFVTSPVFKLPLFAVESNLLYSFRTHSMHEQCVNWCIETNKLPPLLQGAAYIMTLALVEWSPSMRESIDYVETVLRGAGQFNTPPHVTLWGEIRRIQQSRKFMLTVALECMQGLSTDGKREPFLHHSITDLMTLMRHKEANDDAKLAAQAVFTPTTPTANPASTQATGADTNTDKEGVALILQLYMPTDHAKRFDINIALWKNLENEHISDIYLLNEVKMNIAGFPNQHKIHQHVIEQRLTFKMAFEFANEHLVNRTVVIANSDIFFDGTLQRVAGSGARRPQLGAKNTILALLKWVFNQKTGSITMNLRTDSQDAWVFQPPVDTRILQDLDFYMGVPRCDNRIVAVFQKHNQTIIDPGFAVRALELDSVQRTQNLYDTKNTVVGDTDTLLLSDEFIF